MLGAVRLVFGSMPIIICTSVTVLMILPACQLIPARRSMLMLMVRMALPGRKAFPIPAFWQFEALYIEALAATLPIFCTCVLCWPRSIVSSVGAGGTRPGPALPASLLLCLSSCFCLLLGQLFLSFLPGNKLSLLLHSIHFDRVGHHSLACCYLLLFDLHTSADHVGRIQICKVQ